jgi:hypothetical protein
MVGFLKDIIYIYKYKKKYYLNMNYYFRWRGMTVYHVFNIYNVEDHLGLDI